MLENDDRGPFSIQWEIEFFYEGKHNRCVPFAFHKAQENFKSIY